MRFWIQALGVATLIIVFSLFRSGVHSGRPRAGETVIPQLEQPIVWTAGNQGALGIRLYAKGTEEKTARLLDFSAIPAGVNPVANIIFSEGDQRLSSLEVALSHRC